MPVEIRTPFSRTAARQTGPGVWRKRVLPIDTIDYKGRRLNFDRPYLETLAKAFTSGAYDQVSFQLADAGNGHTNDPERHRGEVTRVSVEDDGLWVTVRTTQAGSKVLEDNPHLGISARIVEDYARSDGQYYPAAIQHVLGTLDPRIPNLGAWEKVSDLSNTPDTIIDLSAAAFAGEEGGGSMPNLTSDQEARLARLLELDPARLSALMDGLGDVSSAGDLSGLQGGNGGSGGNESMTDDDLVGLIDSMTDEEFAQLGAEYDLDVIGQQQLAGAGASLSSDYGMNALELANYRVAELERNQAILQGEHDRQRFENEKRALTSLGVPPYITELARPLLEGAGHVIEMSNGQGADAGLIMRRVLKEFGQVTGQLGLDSPVELGSAMDEPDVRQGAEQARSDTVSAFRKMTGI